MDFLESLLPGSGILTLQGVEIDWDYHQIVLQLRSKQATATCPLCQQKSDKQHSGYTRMPADLAWAGFSVVTALDVGKWFCHNSVCPRQVFTERLPDVVAPWARRTQRLARTQVAVGLALGGRAGTRLSRQLQIVTSRDTLLRLVRVQPLDERTTPRVLGIDDWAKCKGQTYGTILVDLENHEVIDILPERSADSIEQWLKAHPGVEIITRDRAGDYAAGASAGAPNAVQVADRWHLLKNLGEVLVDVLKPHRKELRALPLTVDEAAGNEDLAEVIDGSSKHETLEQPKTGRGQQSLEKRTERLARYERVHGLSQQGWTQKAIAVDVGVSRKTVGRWLATDTFPERQSSTRRRRLDPYKPYLLSRWNEGCRNGAQLRREIQAQGYSGGATVVSDFIAQLRREQGLPARSHAFSADDPAVDDPQQAVLTPRKLAGVMFKAPAERTDEQRCLLDRVHEQLSHLVPVFQLVEEFTRLVRDRLGPLLSDWLERAAQIRVFQSFVNGIWRDFAAVYAAMTTEWSNGQSEGQINRLKLIKRQGYGRANFDLLRRLVLLGS